MKRVKKIVCIVITAVMVFSTCGIFFGCNLFARERESGYFRYVNWTDRDNSRVVHIIGLTELGRQQRVLVIPEQIGGRRVGALGRRGAGPLSGVLRGDGWASENLEKIFLPTSKVWVFGSDIPPLPNFRRAIVIDWDSNLVFGGGGVGEFDMNYMYVNYYVSNRVFDLITSHFGGQRANVTYYFNFDTDINHGVHWVDDVGYGGLIEFVPHNPTRSGYTFAGWYREIEGINKWDFESDRLPEELRDENNRVVYQETRLYAKWVKN